MAGNAKGNPGNVGNAKGNFCNSGNVHAGGNFGNAGNAGGNPGNAGNQKKGDVKKQAGKRPEEKECLSCKKKKAEDEFSKYAWNHPADRICKTCLRPELVECSRCKVEKGEQDFSKHAWTHSADRICKDCSRKTKGQWQCIACKKSLGKEMFAKWLSNRNDKSKKDGKTRCNDCMEKCLRVRTRKHTFKNG